MSSNNVLIYQMGKVGSSSIFQSLKRLGPEWTPQQVHSLNALKMLRLAIYYGDMGLAVPEYIRTSMAVLESGVLQEEIKVISLAREPISRNVSAFFENLHNYAVDKTDVDACITKFMHGYHHDIPLRWFDEEIRTVFGLDVFDYDFPKEIGHMTIREGNVELLLLTLETDDEVKAQAIRDFRFLDAACGIRLH